MAGFYLFSVKVPSGQAVLCLIAKRTMKTQRRRKKILIRSYLAQKRTGEIFSQISEDPSSWPPLTKEAICLCDK